MVYCNELFHTSEDIDIRRSAIELLRVVADKRALPWIKSFLDDPDNEIQGWGVGILDQLLFSGHIEPDEAVTLLALAEQHPNNEVRETAAFIKEYLSIREQLNA